MDNEALAFRHVLGSMLARIYHNPSNKDENQSRLQKIVQFWASKEVYDPETIRLLENEMLNGPPVGSFPANKNDLSTIPGTFPPPPTHTHTSHEWGVSFFSFLFIFNVRFSLKMPNQLKSPHHQLENRLLILFCQE